MAVELITLKARSVKHLSWDMSILLILLKFSSTIVWHSFDAARRLKHSLVDKNGKMFGKTTSSQARSHIVGASWSADEHVVDIVLEHKKLRIYMQQTQMKAWVFYTDLSNNLA